MKMVKNVTADVTRIFSYELKCIERKEQLKIKDVNTIVFNHLRFDESLSSWEKPFLYIFTTGIKIKKYFFTFWISVLCKLSAVKSSKVYFVCVYSFIYIFIFLSLV